MNEILDFKKPLVKPLVCIPAGDVKLYGELEIPPDPLGLVLFAHGGGSNRHSPRNQSVARVIRNAGIGTLLFDLLTNEEQEEDAITNEFRFDVELLADRLLAATRWAENQNETRGLKIGYFGASTGGGAAMLAASISSHRITAVVSRGGRPDLAGTALRNVPSPTLLIVGGRDETVLDLNRNAFDQLRCEKELRVIRDASHHFEEHQKLGQVAAISAHWFWKHMSKRPAGMSARRTGT